jgi:hypothetical protein
MSVIFINDLLQLITDLRGTIYHLDIRASDWRQAFATINNIEDALSDISLRATIGAPDIQEKLARLRDILIDTQNETYKYRHNHPNMTQTPPAQREQTMRSEIIQFNRSVDDLLNDFQDIKEIEFNNAVVRSPPPVAQLLIRDQNRLQYLRPITLVQFQNRRSSSKIRS